MLIYGLSGVGLGTYVWLITISAFFYFNHYYPPAFMMFISWIVSIIEAIILLLILFPDPDRYYIGGRK